MVKEKYFAFVLNINAQNSQKKRIFTTIDVSYNTLTSIMMQNYQKKKFCKGIFEEKTLKKSK
jgi:hypothetical protein